MVLEDDPERQKGGLLRSRDVATLFDAVVVNATLTRISKDVRSSPFRRFALYIDVDSAGVDAHIVQIIVEFLNPITGKWHSYLQDVFASLFYEDTVTADGVQEVFTGLVMGDSLRVRLVGTNTTASLTYTLNIGVEFFN